MDYYPINLKLINKHVVVIGGGKIAERKVAGLIESGAYITVISLEITEQLNEWVLLKKIVWKKKVYSYHDIQDAFLIIAATNQPEVNDAVKHDANPLQLISLVDNPNESNFILPSVLKRGKLTISVSTSGASPKLAKKIKQDLSEQYGEEYKEYVNFLFEMREWILQNIHDTNIKQALLSAISEPVFLKSTDRHKDFNELLQRLINKEA